MGTRTRLVLLAAAIGAVLLLVFLAGDDGAPPGAPPAGGGVRAPASPAPAEPAAAPPREVPPAPAEPPEPAVTAPDEPAPEEHVLRVRVVGDDGRPAAGIRVYALPAGATDGDSASTPTAKTDAEGRCALAVTGPGPFDVGAIGPCHGHTLQTDVAAGADAEILLTLPLTGTATLRLAPGLELDAPLWVALDIEGRYGRETSTRPGRGQEYSTTGIFDIERNEFPYRLTLTRGSRYRIRAAGVAVNPDPFTVPAEVTLSPAGETFRVSVRVLVLGLAEDEGGEVSLMVRTRDAGIPLGVFTGAVKGTARAGTMRVRLPGRSGVIVGLGEVAGRTLHGEAEYRGLEPGRETVVRLGVRVVD